MCKQVYTENFVEGLLCIIYILQYLSQACHGVNIPFKFQNKSHIYKKRYINRR